MPGLQAVLHALGSPFRAFWDPGSRHYAPALAVALVLAAIVWWRSDRRESFLRTVFPARVWLHRSALLDYRLIFARALVRLLLTGPLVVSSLLVAARVIITLRASFGAGPLGGTDPALVAAVFTLTAFVAEDFTRFAIHYASHRFAPLWAIHRVHHTAEVMTPFTVHRVHPLESVLNRAGGALAVGLVAGVLGARPPSARSPPTRARCRRHVEGRARHVHDLVDREQHRHARLARQAEARAGAGDDHERRAGHARDALGGEHEGQHHRELLASP
jgi:hypothetical protein